MKKLLRRLSVRLFLSYLLVLLVVVAILWAATTVALPGAFDRHLGAMGMSDMMTGAVPPGGQGGFGRGGPGQGALAELYLGFRASFVEALGLSLGMAAVVAILVSLWVSRRVTAPVRAMGGASQRIAAGHYAERVQVSASAAEELIQLADRFNQMAERLEQVENMRRRLIGDVAHELRTPLTAIQGSMEGLIDGILPASPETYEQIHQEAGRLARLVDDLQELSRVEAGAYSLETHPVPLERIAGTVLRRLEARFAAKGVVLTSELSADLPDVLADEDRLIQVLTNLLANALQYTPSGGTVRLRARAQAGQVHVEVQDTGAGIPAGHLEHIFDRFYRVDRSRSRAQGGGSGIGLTIARHLVEAHGGRIWAESPGEGQGSTFHFTIPGSN